MDRIQQELEVMRRRLEVMQNDLKKFAVELSATSQIAIYAEIARTSLYIKDIEDELEDMQFKNIVNDYFRSNDEQE